MDMNANLARCLWYTELPQEAEAIETAKQLGAD